MVHTGYIAKSVDMTVTPIERDPNAGEFTAQIDDDLFLAEMEDTSGTMVFTYGSSGWDYDPANYGITTDGLALPGDVISVAYQKEVRGTITQSNPSSFYSTGWNLYDHDLLRAKVVHYSDTYGFGIEGTYTQLLFSETLEGETESITVTNGRFTVPSDGYVFVIGGNDTDTAIWMTWSDWQTEPNGGVWEAYSESEIDLSTIMATYFVNGLMAVGSYQDEIDLSLGKVTANVGKMTYTEENLDDVIAMGVEYDYDDSYIYYGLTEPIVSQISIDNTYAAYDHGIEYYTVTQVPIYTQTLYGVNLKNRLERDVVTISQQTLSASEQAQVATNIGAVKKTGDTMTGNLTIANNELQVQTTSRATGSTAQSTLYNRIAFLDSNNYKTGELYKSYGSDGRSALTLRNYQKVSNTEVAHYIQLAIDSEGNRSVSTNDTVAWCDGLGAVKKAGDTMTGDLAIYKGNPDFDLRTTAGDSTLTSTASRTAFGQYRVVDKNGLVTLYILSTLETDGRVQTTIRTRKRISGTDYSHGLVMSINNNGDLVVTLDQTPAWRKALAIGDANGAFPITIAQGGTGSTQVTTLSNNNNNQIIVPSTNITIVSAEYSSWGKMAMVRLNWKSSQDISVPAGGNLSNIQVGTMPSGKRPSTLVFGHSNGDEAGGAWYSLQTNGGVYLGAMESTGSARTITAGTQINAYFCYLLA